MNGCPTPLAALWDLSVLVAICRPRAILVCVGVYLTTIIALVTHVCLFDSRLVEAILYVAAAIGAVCVLGVACAVVSRVVFAQQANSEILSSEASRQPLTIDGATKIVGDSQCPLCGSHRDVRRNGEEVND